MNAVVTYGWDRSEVRRPNEEFVVVLKQKRPLRGIWRYMVSCIDGYERARSGRNSPSLGVTFSLLMAYSPDCCNSET